jgi:MFS family permease
MPRILPALALAVTDATTGARDLFCVVVLSLYRYGRRKATLATCVTFIIFSIAGAFCNDVYSYIALRFLTAAGLAGSGAVTFVLSKA